MEAPAVFVLLGREEDAKVWLHLPTDGALEVPRAAERLAAFHTIMLSAFPAGGDVARLVFSRRGGGLLPALLAPEGALEALSRRLGPDLAGIYRKHLTAERGPSGRTMVATISDKGLTAGEVPNAPLLERLHKLARFAPLSKAGGPALGAPPSGAASAPAEKAPNGSLPTSMGHEK